MNFTETWLKTLLPKKQPYRIAENGLIKGFRVQVTPKGTISFLLCFQGEGKTIKFKTLGIYPVMSLAEARIAALELRKTIISGEYLAPAQIAGTLKDLCDAYIISLEARGQETKETLRVLNKDVLGVLDPNMPARNVTSYDIRVVTSTCIDRGAKVASNRVRSLLSAAFNNGIGFDNDSRNLHNEILFGILINPVTAVPPIAEFETVGERVLELGEIKEIWNYTGEHFSYTNLVAFKLLILLGGLRSGEVTRIKLSEINFEHMILSLPPLRTKSRRWHSIPLTPLTAGLMRELMALNPNASYLFPNKLSGDRPMHETSLLHGIVKLVADLKMEKWDTKDLRRTCKTWMGQAGLSKEIRDRLQNHALTDVSSKHYDRYLYLKEKLEALQVWEKFILEAVS